MSSPSSEPSPERVACTTPPTGVSVRHRKRTGRCVRCGFTKAKCKCGPETGQFRGVLRQQQCTAPARLTGISRALPRTAGEGLAVDLIHCLEDSQLQHRWLQLIPSRIGWNNAVDSAALSLCKARQYRVSNDVDRATIEKSAMQSYGTTLGLLQLALKDPNLAATDASLATVALVSLFEIMLSPLRDSQCLLTNWHVRGLSAILSARPADYEPSELTRGVLCDTHDFTFGYAAAIGTASPFEDERWIDLEPAVLARQSQPCYKLAALRHRTSVQVPRLIAYVRAIREGSASPEVTDNASLLARHLLSLVDEPSETALLHQVKVIRSTDFDDAVVVPSSLNFSIVAEYRDAVLYWMFRLIALNLSLRLVSMHTLAGEIASIQEMRQAQTRMVSNLLMCWQYAENHGLFATTDMSQAFITVWATMKNQTTFKGKPVSSIKRWLLPKIQHPFITWTRDASDSDLDVASDVLEGGPLAAFHDMVRSKGTPCT